MAEHFLSLVEHLVFSGFMPILTKPIIAQMETNKQTKKKQLQNNTVERFVFFKFHANFDQANYCSDGNKQTNKKKATSK